MAPTPAPGRRVGGALLVQDPAVQAVVGEDLAQDAAPGPQRLQGRPALGKTSEEGVQLAVSAQQQQQHSSRHGSVQNGSNEHTQRASAATRKRALTRPLRTGSPPLAKTMRAPSPPPACLRRPCRGLHRISCSTRVLPVPMSPSSSSTPPVPSSASCTALSITCITAHACEHERRLAHLLKHSTLKSPSSSSSTPPVPSSASWTALSITCSTKQQCCEHKLQRRLTGCAPVPCYTTRGLRLSLLRAARQFTWPRETMRDRGPAPLRPTRGGCAQGALLGLG